MQRRTVRAFNTNLWCVAVLKYWDRFSVCCDLKQITWWLPLSLSLSLSVSLSLQSCRGRAASRPSATARVPPAAASRATSRATAPLCPPTRASHSASSPPTSPRLPPLQQEHQPPSSPPAPPACPPHICPHSITLTRWCVELTPDCVQDLCFSVQCVLCFSLLIQLVTEQCDTSYI